MLWTDEALIVYNCGSSEMTVYKKNGSRNKV